MSSVKIQGDPSGTGIFTIKSPNSSTDRELVLPDEAGTVLTSASDIASQATSTVPAFLAYSYGSAQAVTNNTWTKVQLQSEDLDTNNWFDSTTNYRFTPQIEGWYQISGKLRVFCTSSPMDEVRVTIYKNGSARDSIQWQSVNGIWASVVSAASALVYMNGSTDYVELYAYVYTDGGGSIFLSNAGERELASELSGFLVRAA